MKTMQLREAKAKFSELADAVEAGEPVTVTRHGKPVLMMVSVPDGQKLFPESLRPKKTLAQVLMEYPGGIDFEEIRGQFPIKDIDL